MMDAPDDSPIAVVQRQLDAYNAKNLTALLAVYADEVEHYALHGALLLQGKGELAERMAERFAEPDLHAQLLSRTACGSFVVDHERVTRNFPEGRGTLELLCIYEVEQGRIRRASFASGQKVLFPRD